MYNAKRVFSFAIIFAIFAVSHAIAHPSAGHPPKDLSRQYSPNWGIDPEWSLGDLTFSKPKPTWNELTDEEKYILAGTGSSNLATGEPLVAWGTQLFMSTRAYYDEFGFIPDILDEKAIRSVPRYSNFPQERIELLRSPLTGNWPRLTATEFSPGDVYIRPLTEDEMWHFAEASEYYRNVWFNNRSLDPDSGGFDSYTELTSGVYYIRVYGWNGPIVESFQYVRSNN